EKEKRQIKCPFWPEIPVISSHVRREHSVLPVKGPQYRAAHRLICFLLLEIYSAVLRKSNSKTGKCAVILVSPRPQKGVCGAISGFAYVRLGPQFNPGVLVWRSGRGVCFCAPGRCFLSACAACSCERKLLSAARPRTWRPIRRSLLIHRRRLCR